MWLIGAAVAGVIAAWLAGRYMRGNGFGLIGDTIAGVLGAVGGAYVLHSARINLGGGLAGRLVVAFISAIIVLALVHGLTGRRGGNRSWS